MSHLDRLKDFFVGADNDGDLSLNCQHCGWGLGWGDAYIEFKRGKPSWDEDRSLEALARIAHERHPTCE